MIHKHPAGPGDYGGFAGRGGLGHVPAEGGVHGDGFVLLCFACNVVLCTLV